MTQAKKYFNQNVAKCKWSSSCNFNGSLGIAHSFEILNYSYRVQKVRKVLFALTAWEGEMNEFIKCLTESAQVWKWHQRQDCSTGRCMTVNAIIGNHLCRYIFSPIVQIFYGRMKRHAAVASYFNSADYSPDISPRRKGKMSPQTIMTI